MKGAKKCTVARELTFLAKSYSLSLKPSLGILLCKIENGGDDFSKFLFKKPIEEIKILLLIQGVETKGNYYVQ